MDNMREKLSLHYQEDIPDEGLTDEALVSLENYFSHMSEQEMLSHSRPLAIAYLALTHEKERKRGNGKHCDDLFPCQRRMLNTISYSRDIDYGMHIAEFECLLCCYRFRMRITDDLRIKETQRMNFIAETLKYYCRKNCCYMSERMKEL